MDYTNKINNINPSKRLIVLIDLLKSSVSAQSKTNNIEIKSVNGNSFFKMDFQLIKV